MRVWALLLGLLSGLAAVSAPLYADTEADFLCETAAKGTVPDIPAPFWRWAVVVCSPQGQALVPVEGYVWTTQGTLSPASIMAQPPGTLMPPKGPAFDPRSTIRFKQFRGEQIFGTARDRALKRLGIALKDMRARPIDMVFRLEAISNIYEARTSIYFYVKDGTPRSIIACVDSCRRMMVLNVLKVGDDQHASRSK